MTDNQTPGEVGYSRPGFLTKQDRAFLRNEPQNPSQNNEKRRRIRERTKSAFQDFSLLFENLSDQDRQQIFDEYTEEESNFWEETDFSNNLSDMVAFLCLGLATHWPIIDDRSGGHHVREFEAIVSEAMAKAYPELGLVLHSVDFEVSSYNQEEVEALVDHLKRESAMGDPQITPEMVRTLFAGGVISNEEMRTLLKEELGINRD